MPHPTSARQNVKSPFLIEKCKEDGVEIVRK
jgi:hypothetical protein